MSGIKIMPDIPTRLIDEQGYQQFMKPEDSPAVSLTGFICITSHETEKPPRRVALSKRPDLNRGDPPLRAPHSVLLLVLVIIAWSTKHIH